MAAQITGVLPGPRASIQISDAPSA